MTHNVAVLYHRADLDGVLSGVIANFYLTRNHKNVFLQGCDYGDDFSKDIEHLLTMDTIYVIDFSSDELMLHPELSRKIVWIDHHAFAINKYAGCRINQYCIDGVAACRLTQQFFTNIDYVFVTYDNYVKRQVVEPYVVTLAGEHDIWDLKSPMAQRFTFGQRNLEFDTVDNMYQTCKSVLTHSHFPIKINDRNTWNQLREKALVPPLDMINYILQRGEGAIDFVKRTSQIIKGHPVNFCGLNGKAFNTHIRSSLIYTPEPDDKFTMVWCYEGVNKIKVSLYTENHPDVNVALLAAKFKGGGHKCAAGFQTDIPTMFAILANKM